MLIDDDQCFQKGTFEVFGRGVWDGVLVTMLSSPALWQTLATHLHDLFLQSGDLNLALLNELVEQYVLNLYAPAGSSGLAPLAPAFIGLVQTSCKDNGWL